MKMDLNASVFIRKYLVARISDDHSGLAAVTTGRVVFRSGRNGAWPPPCGMQTKFTIYAFDTASSET